MKKSYYIIQKKFCIYSLYLFLIINMKKSTFHDIIPYIQNGLLILGGIKTIIQFFDYLISDTKIYDFFPGECNNQIKLAKQREKEGDKFNPSYQEYIKTLEKAYKNNSEFKIKMERNFTKKQWTAYIP